MRDIAATPCVPRSGVCDRLVVRARSGNDLYVLWSYNVHNALGA